VIGTGPGAVVTTCMGNGSHRTAPESRIAPGVVPSSLVETFGVGGTGVKGIGVTGIVLREAAKAAKFSRALSPGCDWGDVEGAILLESGAGADSRGEILFDNAGEDCRGEILFENVVVSAAGS
jgi:hypothetical protein